MIDNRRIQTGYDIEILLGRDYFLTLLEGAYDAGTIPHKLYVGELTFEVEKPSDVKVIRKAQKDIIEVTVPIDLGAVEEVTVGMEVSIGGNALRFRYSYLDEASQVIIGLIAIATKQKDLLKKIGDRLASVLNQSVPLDQPGSGVQERELRNLPAEGAYQAATGIFLNLDWKISPQSGPPEDAFIPRGDLDKARSFLPAGRSFAVGVGAGTLARVANGSWHRFGVMREDGSIDHPLMDGDKRVGVYKSISISSQAGLLRVEVRFEKFIENFPDADVLAVLHLTPMIKDGDLVINMKMVELDADTGILGDVVGFLFGGLLGTLIGAIFGPAGAAIGAAIGAIGGAAAVEISEEVLSDEYDDTLEGDVKARGLSSFFTAFPRRNLFLADYRDYLFIRYYYIVNLLDEQNVDRYGLSLAGHPVLETVDEPVPATIVDKTRGYGPDSWHGLTSLKYRLKTNRKIELPIAEVLQRIPKKQLVCANMYPTHVHREKTVVKDIRFRGGLELHTSEAIALQDNGVLVVVGYQLIHPRNYNPYYRAHADRYIDNNFESLPKF